MAVGAHQSLPLCLSWRLPFACSEESSFGFELPPSPWSPSWSVGLTGPGVGEGCDPGLLDGTALLSALPVVFFRPVWTVATVASCASGAARPARRGSARAWSAAAPGSPEGSGRPGPGVRRGWGEPGRTGARARAQAPVRSARRGAGSRRAASPWTVLRARVRARSGRGAAGPGPEHARRAAAGRPRLRPGTARCGRGKGLGAVDGRPRVRPGLEDARLRAVGTEAEQPQRCHDRAGGCTGHRRRSDEPAEIGPHVPRFPADN